MITELQPEAWNSLSARLERLPHALLLGGTPGIGKLQLAERFAQLLLCERPLPGAPCGQCEGCRWFLGGNHPDVRFVEPESMARQVGTAEDNEEPVKEGAKEKKAPSTQIKIEQTRALAGFINVGSHRGGRRIILVHPAEAMNAATANSLLKVLEEPPPGAIFLLVSHRPASLLPTIRSRCVSVPVNVPDADRAVAWLTSQGVKQAAGWLAFAGGAPYRALEYAKSDRGAAFEQILRKLAAKDRAALAAVTDRETLETLAEVLQKVALDRAFSLLCGKARYSVTSKPGRGDARAWLAYARIMGRHRLLTRHPLNTRLFAAEMVAGMPEL
jgi:DNA polymerase III subunit delta'